ncbi:MAG: CobD/CbiB family cobalamin biosynthesis protein [Salinarchaeum sp.]
MTAGPWLLVAVITAVFLEWTVIEPPEQLHPVAIFGRALAPCDRAWPTPRLAGVGVALVAPLIAAGVSAVAVALVTTITVGAGAVAGGGVLFVSTSLRMLLARADRTIAASEHDVAAARAHLPALVGRDPTSLSDREIRSAAVESAAENLADGLVAPLMAFLIGGIVTLPLGAAAATWVKAVNTLDSMFGYPDRPFGTAAARLDDAVMWLPARASALLIAIVARQRGALTTARKAAPQAPSPNAGWPMGALAGALDVRLEKPGEYVLNADASLPTPSQATTGTHVVGLAGGVAYALAVLVGVIVWI